HRPRSAARGVLRRALPAFLAALPAPQARHARSDTLMVGNVRKCCWRTLKLDSNWSRGHLTTFNPSEESDLVPPMGMNQAITAFSARRWQPQSSRWRNLDRRAGWRVPLLYQRTGQADWH